MDLQVAKPHARPLMSSAQILTMSSDEQVAYAAIAAIAQAKAGDYCHPGGEKGNEVGEEREQAIGTDAKSLAGMLVGEEKAVLNDLRMQLMSEVRASYVIFFFCCRHLQVSTSRSPRDETDVSLIPLTCTLASADNRASSPFGG